MKQPEQCSSIQDIRAEIDRLDRQIIVALGQRFKYMLAASKFKTSENSVKAPERLKFLLQERCVWAQEQGLSPDMVEKLYQYLVNYFIAEELKHWQSKD